MKRSAPLTPSDVPAGVPTTNDAGAGTGTGAGPDTRTAPATGNGRGGHATHADAAYHDLRRDLLDGTLPPGGPLRFADLQERYGLSVGTLREALTRLVGERLVVAKGQRGFRSAPLSQEELRDIMWMRAGLEEMALRDAIARGDADWEAGIVAAFHRLSRTPVPVPGELGADVVDWERLHSSFHGALVAACPSPWLHHVRAMLEDQSVRYRRLRLRADAPGAIKRDVVDEHRRIMEAVLARDADMAVALMRAHLHRTEDLVAVAFGGE